MYKINFEKPVHVHFIGIGGISMSGLAEILLKEGFTIQKQATQLILHFSRTIKRFINFLFIFSKPVIHRMHNIHMRCCKNGQTK